MGQVRYVGRGQVFSRLRARKTAQKLELVYFSFYLGMNKRHEREIETVLIGAVGAQAYFNTRKKRLWSGRRGTLAGEPNRPTASASATGTGSEASPLRPLGIRDILRGVVAIRYDSDHD